MDTIEKIQTDSLRQLSLETERKEQRDEDKILKLKHDIRENSKYLTELGLGTPIVAHIKADSDNVNSKFNRLIRIIRMKNPELLREIYD